MLPERKVDDIMKFLTNHFYIFSSVFFAVSSQLIIKWKMNEFSFNSYESLSDKFIFSVTMLFNPFIILSLLFTLLSGLSWMIAMTKFDISYAYPFTILGYSLILLFSIIFFHEAFNWQKIIGSLFIMIGIIISSKSLQ